MADFGGARKWAKAIVEENTREGAFVIDATMGNGYDTVWLAKLVGETGRVYAFDIQPLALERTKEKLEAEGLSGRTSLFLMGHQHMAQVVKESADAVVFNLGWLPGTEKETRTRADTTISAVEAALSILKTGGVVTICVYPGHEEGKVERDELIKWAKALDDSVYDAIVQEYVNIRKMPPVLIAVTKRKDIKCN